MIRYPGCACDIPSVNYQVGITFLSFTRWSDLVQFTWARNPNWSHFYSYSEEIWQYLRDIVDRFDLQKNMKLNHEITGAYWDEGKGVWEVHVKNLISGATFIDTAEILINGSGLLK